MLPSSLRPDCTLGAGKCKEETLTDAILLDKKTVAGLLSVSVRTVDNLIARGELVCRRVGRRVLIPRQALEQFARRDHATRPSGA